MILEVPVHDGVAPFTLGLRQGYGENTWQIQTPNFMSKV